MNDVWQAAKDWNKGLELEERHCAPQVLNVQSGGPGREARKEARNEPGRLQE